MTRAAVAAVAMIVCLTGQTASADEPYKLSHDYATSTLRSVDATGCVTTTTYLQVLSSESDGYEYPSFTFYEYSFDACTGTFALGRIGRRGTFDTLDVGVNGASAVGTVAVRNYTTGESSTVAFDLTWSGAGAVENGMYMTQFIYENGPLHTSRHMQWRDATLSGTIDGSALTFDEERSSLFLDNSSY